MASAKHLAMGVCALVLAALLFVSCGGAEQPVPVQESATSPAPTTAPVSTVGVEPTQPPAPPATLPPTPAATAAPTARTAPTPAAPAATPSPALDPTPPAGPFPTGSRRRCFWPRNCRGRAPPMRSLRPSFGRGALGVGVRGRFTAVRGRGGPVSRPGWPYTAERGSAPGEHPYCR